MQAQIRQLLQDGFPLMRFPRELERQFTNDTLAWRRRHFLISGLVALVIYNGFLLVDWLMARDVFWLAVELRLALFTPLSLMVIWALWRPESPVSRLLPPEWTEVFVVISGLMAALTLAVILSETRSPYAHFYHVGFIVVIMYGNVVQRLRFWNAAAFSVCMLGIHLTGILCLPSVPPRLLAPLVSLVTSTALFTLIANYMMERDDRIHYLLTLKERGLVRELSRAHERLQQLSRCDGLTGLYNRRHFQEYMALVWSRAQHDNAPVSVLMCDVDHFKRYNDHYGHPSGDACLQQVAQVLDTQMRRPGDLVARYGGEEFIAVLPGVSLLDAAQAAERVRRAVEALQMRHEASPSGPVVTLSVGVASAAAQAGPDGSSALLSQADEALYQAKHEGRNRVSVKG